MGLLNKLFKVFTVTARTNSSLPGWIAITLPRGHTEGGTLSSLIITTSSILKLFVANYHLLLFCKELK